MKIECKGSWVEGVDHMPAPMGVKEPVQDERISDAACDRCCRAAGLMIDCRRCGKIPTAAGLCRYCENQLDAQMGEPTVTLSVFRAGREPLVGTYDGAGSMLRLRGAMKEPDYCGFALQLVGVRA